MSHKEHIKLDVCVLRLHNCIKYLRQPQSTQIQGRKNDYTASVGAVAVSAATTTSTSEHIHWQNKNHTFELQLDSHFYMNNGFSVHKKRKKIDKFSHVISQRIKNIWTNGHTHTTAFFLSLLSCKPKRTTKNDIYIMERFHRHLMKPIDDLNVRGWRSFRRMFVRFYVTYGLSPWW